MEDVQVDLARRTQQILDAPRRTPGEEESAREKQVHSQCRYAMRLLADRRRSAGEIRGRLRERDVPADVIAEVMARLDRADLLDDAAFAGEWVRQRRASRGLADQALRLELEAKHVEDVHIDRALASEGNDEEERCRDLVRARMRTQALDPSMDAASRSRVSRRLEGYLRRRGYDGALVASVVSSEMLAATGR